MRCVIAMLAVAPAVVAGQSKAGSLRQFQLDAGESIFEFSIGFGFGRVKGRMNTANGTIIYDQANPGNSSVTIIIETKSLQTGSALRDHHLKTSDFFDVDQYPTLRFQSTKLRQNGKDWLMDGQLTMHGVTKTITVPLAVSGPQRDPESLRLLLRGRSTFRLARKDFGITGGGKYNSWFNAARMAMMADSVDMDVEVLGWLADAASQRVPPIVAALERVKTNGLGAQLDRYKAQIAGKPDSALMDYIVGADYLIRVLLEDDRPTALALAKELPALYKGSRAYVIYGHALAVAGDSIGAARQYAEARRRFKRRPSDPKDELALIDSEWYYLDELARASLERGHTRAALGVARLSAELFPDMSSALVTYGWALHLGGDDKAAAEQLARALTVNPNETRAIELDRRIHG